MPDPLATYTIARARASLNRTLPDVSVNSRTLASRSCRVSKAPNEWRPQGLPRYMRIAEWDLRFAAGDGVRRGDSETVTAKGTFAVLMVADKAATPGSYQVVTTARCVQSKDTAGNAVFPVITSDTVVFADSAGNRAQLVTASVYIDELTREDLEMFVVEPGVKFKCIYSPAVAYQDGTVPDADDLIYVPWLEKRNNNPWDPGNPWLTNRGVPITRPRKESGVVAWMMTTFADHA